MNKNLLGLGLSAALLMPALSFAQAPHVDWGNCPANQICCPKAFYCNNTSCGDTKDWVFIIHQPQGSSVNELDLLDEIAYLWFDHTTATHMICTYENPTNKMSVTAVYRISSGEIYHLNGTSWQLSTDQTQAFCQSSDQNQCTLIKSK